MTEQGQVDVSRSPCVLHLSPLHVQQMGQVIALGLDVYKKKYSLSEVHFNSRRLSSL